MKQNEEIKPDKDIIDLIRRLDTLQNRLNYFYQPEIIDSLLTTYCRDLNQLKAKRCDSVALTYESWLENYKKRFNS